MRSDCAAAQPLPSAELDVAKALIQGGDAIAAQSTLERALAVDPRNIEVLFLLGLSASMTADYDAAVSWFRQALVLAPKATRIRLELARAFYRKRDYDNAFRQFQFARAGNPPVGVIASIDRYLSAIRREKSWSYTISFALAPDTNINNATAAREAEFLGLPFTLSDDARQHSGIGLALEAGAEVAPRVATSLRWRVGASFQRREYNGGRFDDMTIAAHSGPRWTGSKWDLSILGTGFRRWNGGRRYVDGYGGRIEATHYPDGRTAISAALSGQKVRFARTSDESGSVYSGQVIAVRALTPASNAQVRVGGARQLARSPAFSRWSWSAGLGYYRDLSGGFSVYVEPSYLFSRHDASDPLFGRRRLDHLTELQIALLNRRLVLSRLTPRLAYTWARRRSTVQIFSYDQHRIELGVTSRF